MAVRRLSLFLAACAVGGACAERPPHLVLTVEDQPQVAAGFATLWIGQAPDALAAVTLEETTFPVRVTVTADSPGTRTLWVEARAGNGVPLGRGSVRGRFARTGSPAATVALARACTSDAECQDGLFCSGTVACVAGACATVTSPCASDFPCVVTSCTDLGGGAGACGLSVDHARCPGGTYCDPGGGCLPGQRCMPETGVADCDDGSACNGVERCDRFRCERGATPVVDDGDPCTLDGCNDAASPPVFHEPLAANEGNGCTSASVAAGRCVAAAGGCIACDTAVHCGPACQPCPATTPICAAASVGCVCAHDPAPRGSCPRGSRCDGAACVPCADVAHCGPDCVACDAALPSCGGPQAGCVASGCAGRPDFTPCAVVTTPDRWYDICVGGVCVSPGCGNAGCNPPGPSFARADTEPSWRFPDGHQTLCYDLDAEVPCPTFPCAADGGPDWCGQDGQYVGGGDFGDPLLRWSRSPGDEPTVTDHLTGLVWQGCAADLYGPACDAPDRYLFGFSWADALAFCDSLEWAGHRDWRLPDVAELLSLADDRPRQGAWEEVLFPGSHAYGPLWSAARTADNVGYAWTVWGSELRVGGEDYLISVLCVRFDPPRRSWGAAPRFARSEPVSGSGELVVVDQRTGFEWQGCALGENGPTCGGGARLLFHWADALRACESLVWAGAADWRLPSRVELLTLFDWRRPEPGLDPAVFPGNWDAERWTSTTPPDDPDEAATVSGGPHANDAEKNYYNLPAFCVRGGL